MKISFVTPAYNCATWLAHCIESVLQQKYDDVEHVIVDDCSTDTTPALLAHYKDHPKIKTIRSPINMGRSASRNAGNMLASGDVICVLDADDLATPERAKLVSSKFASGAQFLYGTAIVIDALGFEQGRYNCDVFNKRVALERKENGIVHSTVAYTKALAAKFPYNMGRVAQLGIDDWEQQFRMFMSGVPFEATPRPLAHYRLLESAVTQTRDQAAVWAEKDRIMANWDKTTQALEESRRSAANVA